MGVLLTRKIANAMVKARDFLFVPRIFALIIGTITTRQLGFVTLWMDMG
jgi:hypothetical protein